MMKHEQATLRSLSDDTEHPALQQRSHRRVRRPVGILAGGIIGGVVGGLIGSKIGQGIATKINNAAYSAIHGGGQPS
jgi:surface antigen